MWLMRQQIFALAKTRPRQKSSPELRFRLSEGWKNAMFQLDGSAFLLDEVELCGSASDGSKGQRSAGQGRGTLLGREDQSGANFKPSVETQAAATALARSRERIRDGNAPV